MWEKVLENDRKDFGLDSINLQNSSEWREHLGRRLVRQVPPSTQENQVLDRASLRENWFFAYAKIKMQISFAVSKSEIPSV